MKIIAILIMGIVVLTACISRSPALPDFTPITDNNMPTQIVDNHSIERIVVLGAVRWHSKGRMIFADGVMFPDYVQFSTSVVFGQYKTYLFRKSSFYDRGYKIDAVFPPDEFKKWVEEKP